MKSLVLVNKREVGAEEAEDIEFYLAEASLCGR
jgi:hypothetical protein